MSNELSGVDTLKYLNSLDGRFVKVLARDKKPFEDAWQQKPYTLEEILPHFQSGGSVGMITGRLSANIGLLDVDERYSEFCRRFPDLAHAPAIVRNGGDKAKILIRVDCFSDDMPGAKKWKRPGEKKPFFEWLSDGNQGVVSGIHPAGGPYRLINVDEPMAIYTPEELSALCKSWTGIGLLEPDEPEIPANMPKPAKREYPNGDGLREKVLEYWTPLKVFQHFGMVNRTRWESHGEWMRLFGNGGLFIHKDGDTWNLVAIDGIGGDAFDAWWYANHGDCSMPKDHGFYDLLCEMAEAAGIEIPKRESAQISEPEAPPAFENEEESGLAKERPPRYVIRDASFALQPRDPLKWVLENTFTIPSLNLMYAEAGSKKTYAMLSFAVCVALGKPWLGMKTVQLAVLYVDEEMGEDRISRRIAETIRGEFGDEDTPIRYISLAGFYFDNLDDVNALHVVILETRAKLVIIDALTDVMAGDENSKQDVQPVFNNLRRVSEATGACIIIIHHSNKQGGYRGSSAIKGSVDQMIEIKSNEDDPLIYFKSQKARDSKHSRFAAEAHWNEDQFWLSAADMAKTVSAYSKSQTYVIRFLQKHGPSSLPDIMGAADSCSPNAARLAVYTLTDLGICFRTNPDEKGRGAVAIYDLADADETN